MHSSGCGPTCRRLQAPPPCARRQRGHRGQLVHWVHLAGPRVGARHPYRAAQQLDAVGAVGGRRPGGARRRARVAREEEQGQGQTRCVHLHTHPAAVERVPRVIACSAVVVVAEVVAA